ncbi:hypothetical protein F966_01403 [Acinetobacter higginsii]|uniref:Nucleoid-associated protein n=1 Tax=Acinetobacter higginsii TaxID=70347 RepID=N8XT12_9GAMM|nr:nucleoid-associated protein [Acinetobacter higginsii]ENV10230.1 hypothetical protein F966_01403 [Acinetobacter higginsii]
MSLFKINEVNKFITHFVGNKIKGEGLRFSEKVQDVNEIEQLLIKLIEKNFSYDEKFCFNLNNIENNNPIYSIVNTMFENEDSFFEQSKLVARYLYEKSDHPQIKSGELCVGKCDNLIYHNNSYQSLFIFKSEIKDDFLKVISEGNQILIKPESGIGLNKVDKGCVVIKNQESIFIFLINDLVDKNVKYWNDDFLNISPVDNDYLFTKSYLDSVRKVVSNTSFENNLQKVKYLSKTMNFFEENDFFEEDLYKEYLNNDEMFFKIKDLETSVSGADVKEFKISHRIVNKNKRIMKRVIKLDDNFDIFIKKESSHVETGVDHKGKYYKFYYESES